MKILQYNDLDVSGLKAQFKRTATMLSEGNFRGADVRKLQSGPYYRAKLSDADRLLFRFASCRDETYLVLLEVIRHHAYEASRFLRGAVMDESKLVPLDVPAPTAPSDVLPLNYVNPTVRRVHVLDKILSFDELQEDALRQRPPLILIGSAGSGKTVLTLEKLRQLPGEVLYVTLSPYLADNARTLYYSHHYENPAQEVDFLSFQEFVHSIGVPAGKPLTFRDFAAWFARHRALSPVKDAHPVYEEFNGVLTGSAVTSPYLAPEEYLALGVRRSIFSPEERPAIYELFRRYLAFLETSGFHDLNLVCFSHHARCTPAYDFVVADEVQDLTSVQLSLILRALRYPDQFVLCGDSNQIVHPNFFSWAAVKSFFYENRLQGRGEIIRTLNTNYRNSPEITAIANRLLLIKNARFGSIDRESHYLVNPVSTNAGSVEFLRDSQTVRRDIDQKTGRSARFAVLVMREEDKEDARRTFRTPLVFSVQEAKGLEYENILLLNFVSSNAAAFDVLTEDVTADDLEADFTYARARDKGDKSLEAYKFFVNALYVAITRAVRNLYLLEQNPTHRLLTLLALGKSREEATLDAQQSSVDEWKAEARRLEQQGKTEQVDAIRRTILHTQAVPWKVLTPANVGEFAQAALAPASGDKPRRLLLDYAVTYSVRPLLLRLRDFGFMAAKNPDTARQDALMRHSVDVRDFGQRELRRKMDLYGIDFRNPLNQTPLMIATELGLVPLVEELVRNGAGTERCDNWGRTAFQIALRAAYKDPVYAKRTLGAIYPVLAPPAQRVRVGGRMLKIDSHRMEFFLLHSMIALMDSILGEEEFFRRIGFETADVVFALQHFPDSVVPQHLRKREALTRYLAGNEVYKDEPRNRQIFLRLSHGHYFLNPVMDLELDGVWTNVKTLLQLDVRTEGTVGVQATGFVERLRRMEKQVTDYFARRETERLAREAQGATGTPTMASPKVEEAPAVPAATAATDATSTDVFAKTRALARAAFEARHRGNTDAASVFESGFVAAHRETPPVPPQDGWNRKVSPRAAGADTDEVGRNEPRPCGSGRKDKKCCGRNSGTS